MNSLTTIAIQAALGAGELLKKGFGTSFSISSKEGRQNLVTEYDYAAEKSIISFIHEIYPDHGFVAEESGGTPSKTNVTWVIDPLDGTVNFAHNIPIFSVSIAAYKDGEVISGVVYQPITQELFVAEKGIGAFLNGQRIKVSSTPLLSDALMTTGFPYNVYENPSKCIDTFANMVKLGIPIRRLGSAAIDLCYVAAGRFDAYWELNLNPWDIAAGMLIIKEAGGRTSHYNGSPIDLFSEDKTIVASNGLLHEQMLAKIK